MKVTILSTDASKFRELQQLIQRGLEVKADFSIVLAPKSVNKANAKDLLVIYEPDGTKTFDFIAEIRRHLGEKTTTKIIVIAPASCTQSAKNNDVDGFLPLVNLHALPQVVESVLTHEVLT